MLEYDLSDDEYIESRVTGRSQVQNQELFFADEFVIQNVHKKGVSRIDQVEVMSKFYQCDKQIVNLIDSAKPSICGLQYVSSYGSRVGDNQVKAIKSEKYELYFQSIDN